MKRQPRAVVRVGQRIIQGDATHTRAAVKPKLECPPVGRVVMPHQGQVPLVPGPPEGLACEGRVVGVVDGAGRIEIVAIGDGITIDIKSAVPTEPGWRRRRCADGDGGLEHLSLRLGRRRRRQGEGAEEGEARRGGQRPGGAGEPAPRQRQTRTPRRPVGGGCGRWKGMAAPRGGEGWPGGTATGQAAMAGGAASAPEAQSWRSALGARRSALGARRSALGARRSALGARRSALGARRSALKYNICRPCSIRQVHRRPQTEKTGARREPLPVFIHYISISTSSKRMIIMAIP